MKNRRQLMFGSEYFAHLKIMHISETYNLELSYLKIQLQVFSNKSARSGNFSFFWDLEIFLHPSYEIHIKST